MNSTPSTPDAPTSTEPSERGAIIRWIVLAIMVWGLVHAIGAWSLNWNPLRAVVVLVCVGGFLGFWMTMLAVRQRRLTRRR